MHTPLRFLKVYFISKKNFRNGYPWYDILYSTNKESLIKKIKQELGIGEDKKLFYMHQLGGTMN